MNTKAASVPAFRGTPLGAAEIAVLTTVSTLLFTVYPKLLWETGPHESHFARFLVSYAAVVPLATIAVWWRHRRISKRDLTAAVIVVWSIKMILTVGMYHFMVAGGHSRPEAAPAQVISRTVNETSYSGSTTFSGRRLNGRVVAKNGGPLPGAVVALAGFHKGKAVEPSQVRLTYTDSGFEPASLAVLRGSRITLVNKSDSVVVMAGTLRERTVFNVPVVPGAVRDAPVGSDGVLTVRPQTTAQKGIAQVLVAPTPYIAVADAEGRFRLMDVPDTPFELWLLAPGASQVEKTQIVEQGTTEIDITVAATQGNS